MVNVMGMIRREKERFRNIKHKRTKSRIMSETAQLEAEKRRQGEMAKISAQKQSAERDVQALSSYNARVEGPTKGQKFASGLQKAINKGKEFQQSRKAVPQNKLGGSQGIQFGGSGFGGGMNKGPDFGSGGSPFGFQKKEVVKKEKPIVIRINR